MSSLLRLYLPAGWPSEDASCDWMLLDAAGKQLQRGHSEARHWPEAEDCEIILSAEQCLLLYARLPKVNKARLTEVIHFAVEDYLLGDAEAEHFVAGDRDADGMTPIWVIARARLKVLLAALNSEEALPEEAMMVGDHPLDIQTARAAKDSSISIFLYAPAIGPFFQPGILPKTEALFMKVRTDISEPLDRVKDHWKRRRPYQLDESLSLGAPEPSYGYPSGHSTRGTVQALLLAELFPEQREAILAIGRNIGWDRVLIGKHFPTDIYAARVLGQAIVHELLASPAFQRDLAEAKAEVQAAKGSP